MNTHARQDTGVSEELADGGSETGSTTLTLKSGGGASFSVGDWGFLSTTDRYEGDSFRITAVNGDTITLDRPIELTYPAGVVEKVLIYLNEASVGTISSPQVFSVRVYPGEKLNITSIILHGESVLEPRLDQFIGIAGLANGLVMRHKDGTSSNKLVMRRNSDMYEFFGSLNVSVIEKAPAGEWAINALWPYCQNVGCVIKLDGDQGDELQFLIQDDITGVEKLEVVVQGYYFL